MSELTVFPADLAEMSVSQLASTATRGSAMGA